MTETTEQENIYVTFDGRHVNRGNNKPLNEPTRSLDEAIKVWEDTTRYPWTSTQILAAKKAATIKDLYQLKTLFNGLPITDHLFEPYLLGALWNPGFITRGFEIQSLAIPHEVIQNAVEGAPIGADMLKNLARTPDYAHRITKRKDKLETTVQHSIVDHSGTGNSPTCHLALREDLSIGLQLALYRHKDYNVRVSLAENRYLDSWI